MTGISATKFSSSRPSANAPLHLLDAIEETEAVEKVVGKVIEAMSEIRASDLFFALDEHAVMVSCRQMGLLRPLRPFSPQFGRRLISHIKALAGIDIGDRYRPAEGRWILHREHGAAVDLRINCLPTIHGEDLTIRLLDREFGLIPLEQFGLFPRELQAIHGLLQRNAGLILVTGPTGSGKSTTLYSCLQHLNDGSRKINTLEDPVEYLVKGIRQSQINPKMGVDFADLLMACMRQSPDVIMVGEIRDPQTATTAVRAAASGHLVLATMHAPVAVKAVGAMVGFGVSPRSFAESLLGVISQRLVRQLCADCRRPIDMSPVPSFLEELRAELPRDWSPSIFAPGGCERCHGTGYRRSHCVPEILLVTGETRRRIGERYEPREIEEGARRNDDWLSFRRSAMLRVATGITTIEEIMRTIPFEELEERTDGAPTSVEWERRAFERNRTAEAAEAAKSTQ